MYFQKFRVAPYLDIHSIHHQAVKRLGTFLIIIYRNSYEIGLIINKNKIGKATESLGNTNFFKNVLWEQVKADNYLWVALVTD